MALARECAHLQTDQKIRNIFLFHQQSAAKSDPTKGMLICFINNYMQRVWVTISQLMIWRQKERKNEFIVWISIYILSNVHIQTMPRNGLLGRRISIYHNPGRSCLDQKKRLQLPVREPSRWLGYNESQRGSSNYRNWTECSFICFYSLSITTPERENMCHMTRAEPRAPSSHWFDTWVLGFGTHFLAYRYLKRWIWYHSQVFRLNKSLNQALSTASSTSLTSLFNLYNWSATCDYYCKLTPDCSFLLNR